MSKQKDKGTKFETAAKRHVDMRLGEGAVHRAALSGNADKGDLHGLKMKGRPVVVECKDRARYDFQGWLREAEVERGNADAEYGVVLCHLKGVGAKRFGENAVVMTLDTFLAMIAGGRDLLMGEEDG